MNRRVRTLRGQVSVGGGKGQKQLILNDQLINRGLKVTGFFVWPEYADFGQDGDFNAILSYAPLRSGDVKMNASDNSQIGWAWSANKASLPAPNAPGASSGYMNQIIDPDHMINRNLFVSFRESSNRLFNFMVVCELRELTDAEAIITITKENSQSLEAP